MPIIELKHLNLGYLALGDIEQKPVLVFCPGIMGNKKNLEHFVKKLLAALPQYSALIFDLRNHGESSKSAAPFTVEACALDVVEALEKLKLKPLAVFGHSFGGKVGLLIAEKMLVKEAWLLDTPPGAIASKPLNKDSLSVFEIIDKLRKTEWPKESRNDVVKDLIARGVAREIALWMTTNLKASLKGYYLVFEPSEIERMLLDFINLDLWPLVSALSEKVRINVVAAEHGHRFNAEDYERFKGLKNGKGQFHVLKDSGHFVHVDNPSGLIRIIEENLAS